MPGQSFTSLEDLSDLHDAVRNRLLGQGAVTFQVHFTGVLGPVTVKSLLPHTPFPQVMVRVQAMLGRGIGRCRVLHRSQAKELHFHSRGTLRDHNIGPDCQFELSLDRGLGGWGEVSAAASTTPGDHGLIPGDTGLVQGNQVRMIDGKLVPPEDLLTQQVVYGLWAGEEFHRLCELARDAGLSKVLRPVKTVERESMLLDYRRGLLAIKEAQERGVETEELEQALWYRVGWVVSQREDSAAADLKRYSIDDLQKLIADMDVATLEQETKLLLQLKALVPRAIGVANCDNYAMVTTAHLVAQTPPVKGAVQYAYYGSVVFPDHSSAGHSITVTTPELIEPLPAWSTDFNTEMADVVDGWMNNQVITVRDYEAGNNCIAGSRSRVELDVRYTCDGSMPEISEDIVSAFVKAVRLRGEQIAPKKTSRGITRHGEEHVYNFTSLPRHAPDPHVHDRRTPEQKLSKLRAILTFCQAHGELKPFEAEAAELLEGAIDLPDALLLTYFDCSDRARDDVIARAPFLLYGVLTQCDDTELLIRTARLSDRHFIAWAGFSSESVAKAWRLQPLQDRLKALLADANIRQLCMERMLHAHTVVAHHLVDEHLQDLGRDVIFALFNLHAGLAGSRAAFREALFGLMDANGGDLDVIYTMLSPSLRGEYRGEAGSERDERIQAAEHLRTMRTA